MGQYKNIIARRYKEPIKINAELKEGTCIFNARKDAIT